MVVDLVQTLDRYYPGTQGMAVVGIVLYEDNVLLGKKRDSSKGSFTGRWHLPGEKLEEGESYTDALIRGIKEEAEISVIVGREIARGLTPRGRLLRWYECEAQSPDIRPSEELPEVKWVKKNDVYNFLDDYVKQLWPNEVKEYFSRG